MFELYNKDTLEKTRIYSVKNDKNGYPHFLIKKDRQWLWKSAKEFITEEEKRLYLKNSTIICTRLGIYTTPRCIYLQDKKWCTSINGTCD